MAKRKDFHFSPTEYHQRLMDTLPLRTLGYRGGDLLAWQGQLRAQIRLLTGYDRIDTGQRCNLNVQSLWKREHKLGTIEKIVFTAEPCADVPAYVCLPKNATAPYPWFVCLQGHSTGMHNSIAVDLNDNSKSIQVSGDRDFGLWCMKNGVAALCIEQRSFGERSEKKMAFKADHGCHDATMHALMLGRTLLAERVFDVERGMDYLMTRDDVDPARIGVMGNSGGGTISLFSAALLPRITHCMPSCYFCTFRDSIMSVYHCMDNFVPGLLPVAEMWDIMGLFAPKPVVLVAGKQDPLFPIAATRKAFRHLKEIYAAAGAEDRCQLVVGPEGHRFYGDLAWPKMRRELNRNM